MTKKPILCLDFDGVIHSYNNGWLGIAEIQDPITMGFFDWLEDARKFFDIVIYSSRSSSPIGITAMRNYILREATAHYGKPSHGIMADITFADTKPAAFLTIDDRALMFSGKWSDYNPETLLKFKPWNKRTQFTGPFSDRNET